MRYSKYFHIYFSVVSMIGAFNCIWFTKRAFFEDHPQSFQSDLIALCEGGTLFLSSIAANFGLYRINKQQDLLASDTPVSETTNPIHRKSIQQIQTLDTLPNFVSTASKREFRSNSFLNNLIQSEQKQISELKERLAVVKSFTEFLSKLKNTVLKPDQNKNEQIRSQLEALLAAVADQISDFEQENSISEFLQARKKELELGQRDLQFFLNTVDLMISQLNDKISSEVSVYPVLEQL